VTDYNEHEQWEQLKLWLKQNGLWILAGVAIGVAALAGWRWYQARQDQMAIQAGTRFEQVLEAFGRNDRTRAMTLIDELKRDHAGSPYADFATLTAAKAFVETNELDRAAASLSEVMTGTSDPELALVARLRLARVQSAQGKHDVALTTLSAVPAGEFSTRFAEARGDALLAKGDKAAALKEYQTVYTSKDDGRVDREMLELKIRDLGGTPPPLPPVAAPPLAAN
jgi:predicted negative regulator of RcsB-dependent stress response